MPQKASIIVIDDDPIFREIIQECLLAQGYQPIVAACGQEGLEAYEKHLPAVVLLDQELPDMKGLEVFQRIMQLNSEVKVIFLTAYPTFQYAVEAIRNGAYDYLTKPFEPDQLNLLLRNAVSSYNLERIQESCTYKLKAADAHLPEASRLPSMQRLHPQIVAAATSSSPVLITGETGVGKNILARLIHNLRHGNKPDILINCTALPEHLIESELFGHEKGAFTGAVATKKGVFELANHSTLVLDEICDMPYHLQARFLSILEEGSLRRLGGHATIPVDVKVIATTNADVLGAVKGRSFRQDLYYRLSTITLELPPLRERTDDIEYLTTLFIQDFSRLPLTLAPDQLAVLKGYGWPGNIRELRNLIERSVLLHQDGLLRPADHLPGRLSGAGPGTEKDPPPPRRTLKEIEWQAIRETLAFFAGNKSASARSLGISLNTLKRQLREMGCDGDDSC